MLSDDDLEKLDRKAVENLINIDGSLSGKSIQREFARLILERAAQECDKAAKMCMERKTVDAFYSCDTSQSIMAEALAEEIRALIPKESGNDS